MPDPILITYGGFATEAPDCGGALREAGYELRMHPRDSDRTPDELAALADGAVASIADADPFDADVLQRSPRLRGIARGGVAATTTPNVKNETVADHALALILPTPRRIVESDATVRAGGWRSFGEGG